jgi:uncharacterized membrane protein (GlpM family)
MPYAENNAMNARNAEKILPSLFFFLMALPLFFILRFLDDNSFTSWKWVFSGTSMLHIYVYLAAGLVIAVAVSRFAIPERYYPFLLFGSSFLCITPLWNQPESIIDASRYFLQAKYLSEYGPAYFLREWGNHIDAWTDMPLIPFSYGLIFRLFGEVRLYIQIFTTLLFSSTVLLTYLTGKILWDEETGFYSGLLLLGMPYLLIQVPLLLVDVPTMFFVTLAIYSFMKAMRTDGLRWILLSCITIQLAVLSKYSALLMLPVLPLISFVFLPENRKKVLCRTAAIIISAGFVSGIIFFSMSHILMPQIDLLRTFQMSGLGRWKESFTSTFFFQVHPYITIFSFYAIYVAIKKKDRRFLVSLFFALFVLILQVKRIRYIIPLFPLFAIMAAYGICAMRSREVRRLVSACIVVSSFVICYSVYLPFLNRTSMANLRNAGEYLDSLKGSTVVVSALPQSESIGNTVAAIPIVDYFTKKRILSRQDWSKRSGSDDISTSSLRFTHELRKPAFYSDYAPENRSEEACYLLVISSDEVFDTSSVAIENLPLFFKEIKSFHQYEDVFKFRTFATVYANVNCP